ncbi:MAG: maleylpyruvate isomerase family mycothiol-dependent enzyme [Acidimicrobiales bacterium]
MTELQPFVAPTYEGLADLLAGSPTEVWDAPSLCEGWQVRHVISHVTMPARLTPEDFGAEMAASGGDFTVLSNTVASRDASLPLADHLDALRAPLLHEWQPPGGGEAAALGHAVIHSLDVTIPLDCEPVAPKEAVLAVLGQLTSANGGWFGVDLAGIRLEATDTDWSWGNGNTLRADSGCLVALLSGRALPDGRALERVEP